MAAAAHIYSVELGHHEEPQVAVHLLASQPHGTYAEVFHPNRDPIWWKIIANRPEVVDGCFALPPGPVTLEASMAQAREWLEARAMGLCPRLRTLERMQSDLDVRLADGSRLHLIDVH